MITKNDGQVDILKTSTAKQTLINKKMNPFGVWIASLDLFLIYSIRNRTLGIW